MPSFYEFFAGGGMARAGLGKGWTCLFANDWPAAGFMDTEKRCLMKPEVVHGKASVSAGI